MENNVVYRVKDGAFHQHYGREKTRFENNRGGARQLASIVGVSCYMRTVWVEYRNTGTVAMPAPLLQVSAGGNGLLTTDEQLANDGRFQFASVTGPGGERYRYSYDSTGNLTGIRDALNLETSFSYEPAHQRLTSFTDARGNGIGYEYDAANELLSEESPAGLTTYVCDGSGNRIEKNAPAETTYYTWDEDSRLVAAEPPAGVTTLVYNADGLRVGKETPSESTKFNHVPTFQKYIQNPNLLASPADSGRPTD